MINQFPSVSNGRFIHQLPQQQLNPSRPINKVAGITLQAPSISIQPTVREFQALLASKIRFGSHQLVEKEYVTTLHPHNYVTPDTILKTLMVLNMHTQYKKEDGDRSHLKIALGPSFESNNAMSMSLSNALFFVERPVDTIVSGIAGPASIPLMMLSRLYDGHKLLNSPNKDTGKSFVYPQSRIKLGPVIAIAGGGEAQVIEAQRKIANSQLSKRIALFMKATGIRDIKQAHKDLTSAKQYSALEALAYGEKGLVDGILIGRDQVLTRQNLDRFYQEQGFYQDQNLEHAERRKNEFNQNIFNVQRIEKKYLVPLRTLSSGSMLSHKVTSKRANLFQSMGSDNKRDQDAPPNSLKMGVLPLSYYGTGIEMEEPYQEPDSVDGFFTSIVKPRHFESKINGTCLQPIQLNLVNSKKGSSLIDDDVIYFGDSFSIDSADRLIDSIRVLKEKKAKQNNPSNIKLFLDSPGGDSTALYKVLQELDSDAKIKTDIILNGRAYSCGGLLLSAATGNRLATPVSEIMFHNGSVQGGYASNEEANQEAENMKQSNKNAIRLVAKGSQKAEKDVEFDFLKTTFMNVLDGLFYGKRGLLDGILIGSHQVITRKNVMDYLIHDPEAQAEINDEVCFFEGKTHDPNFESENPPEVLVKKYLAHRWQTFHDRSAIEPDMPNSLFDDPLNTIMKIASRKDSSYDMLDSQQFKDMIPYPGKEDEKQAYEIAHFLIPATPSANRRA